MRALFFQLLDLLYPPKCVFCRRLLRPEEHDVCARCAHELEPIPAPARAVLHGVLCRVSL